MDNMNTFSIVRIVDVLWVASQLQPEDMLPAPSAGHAWGQATVDALHHPVLAFCRTGRRSTAPYRGKGAA
jgi:protein tyrosine phosphatase (PTP) superfamily phosphohydrolase (DUF442 family)